jgi:hypothetical protein
LLLLEASRQCQVASLWWCLGHSSLLSMSVFPCVPSGWWVGHDCDSSVPDKDAKHTWWPGKWLLSNTLELVCNSHFIIAGKWRGQISAYVFDFRWEGSEVLPYPGLVPKKQEEPFWWQVWTLNTEITRKEKEKPSNLTESRYVLGDLWRGKATFPVPISRTREHKTLCF